MDTCARFASIGIHDPIEWRFFVVRLFLDSSEQAENVGNLLPVTRLPGLSLGFQTNRFCEMLVKSKFTRSDREREAQISQRAQL